jgi:glycosyltransferase involved in cell wall biosynthesis
LQVTEQLTGSVVSENAFLLATSGRYEYRNKGIDLFIEALHWVKQAQPAREMVAFILVPAWISAPRNDLQERLAQGNSPEAPLPDPYITHHLVNFQEDKICNYLRHLHFTNQDRSPVKLIFVPSYLNGDDGIFNLPYYDLLAGLDLTVFPSYYEPWGYTPLESIAFHIPTITTNLAGFGLWARQAERKRKNADQQGNGVVVVERTDANYFEAAETIKNTVIRYAEYDARLMTEARKAAFTLSQKADWAHFIRYYLKAYDEAIRKKG